MKEIKVVDISKKGRKEKLAFLFPDELIKAGNWKKVRQMYFITENDSNEKNSHILIQVIRTRTNRERVKNIRLPKGSQIKLDHNF